MKKICTVGLAMALLLGGLVTSASATPYVSGDFGLVKVSDSTFSGGGSSVEVSFDQGFGFIAAVGNNFDGLRGEVEMAYRTNDRKKTVGDITSLALMGNLLVDLPLSDRVQPFLGAGIGLTNVEFDSGINKKDDTVFAYQAIAGIGFPVSNITTIDLQYRYFASANPNFNGTEAEYHTHNFFAGLRFDF